MTALDLITCLKQIKYLILFLTCAPVSELPSNKTTLIISIFRRIILHHFCNLLLNGAELTIFQQHLSHVLFILFYVMYLGTGLRTWIHINWILIRTRPSKNVVSERQGYTWKFWFRYFIWVFRLREAAKKVPPLMGRSLRPLYGLSISGGTFLRLP